MKKSWSQTTPITLILLLLALAACRTGESPTPTPFPATSTPAPTAAGEPLPVALSDLAENPQAFEGVFIQLTGQYQRLPRLICRADPHPSPAAWAVAGDNYVAQVSGFDAQLRSLLPERITVTVAGTWRQWRGPIGCGKRAVATRLWYLEGKHILSPSPLAQVTLTPTFVGAAAGEATAVAADLPGTPSPTVITPEEPQPTAPAGLPTSTLPGDTGETATPTIFAPATPTPGTQGPPTATGDPDATATPTPGTATPTPAGPTPTGDGDYTVVEVDEIEPGFLGFEQLDAYEKHNWPFFLDTSQTVTISVAAEPAVNVVLAILDGSQTPLVEQNQAPAGQLETIAGRVLDPNQDHFIQVYAADGAPASYVMTVWGDDSLVLRARGILDYGSTMPDALGEDEVNYWFFTGNAGEAVTITARPNDNSDILLILYGPDGTEVADAFEGGNPGLPVNLSTPLPETGMYAIAVEEYDFAAASYQISLTRN